MEQEQATIRLIAYSGRGEFQPLMEGTYTRGDGRDPPQVRWSDVPCPYCREPMIEAIDAQSTRVRRVVERYPGGRALVDADRIPESHRTVGCRECRAVFTLPKAGR